MAIGSNIAIHVEGIFVSCSQGATRLWEFHPDDVTSIGIYREDNQTHEVIVTLNRDFDVPGATRGLEELNERLSRELNARLHVDAERGSSRSGVVVWPSHLAGSPLWEFCIFGEDGLASYVSPGTPKALRNLCRPVCREMVRFAKLRLPEQFPKPLIERGFTYHGYIGWKRDDAIMAAEWLHGKGAAIVDAELWLVKDTVVQPYVKTDSGLDAYHYWTTTRHSETWEAFKDRSLTEPRDFVRGFRWPTNTAESGEQVRFCLS